MSALPLNAAFAAPTAPISRASDELIGLADIYQSDTNLTIWQRSLESEIQQAAQQLVSHYEPLQVNQMVTPENVSQTLSRILPKLDSKAALDNMAAFDSRAALIEDITLLVDAFCCLFERDRAGLRFTKVDHAMCPRFHVDQVPCRLITTYAGPATEWLMEQDLERSKLGRGSLGLADQQSGLIKAQASIQQMRCGDVALLKGERWQGNEGQGLVHRSPMVAQGQSRLILTLDMA